MSIWGAIGGLARSVEKRRERVARIREALSLENARAQPQTRVIPGEQLPEGVAGPPAPEQVEQFVRKFRYNEDAGEYEGYDEPISRTPNQWAESDVSIKEAGGQRLTKRTERDLAGRERSSFDIADAAPKLREVRRTEGDKLVTYMVDEQGKPVEKVAEAPRYKPGGPAGDSDERIRARDTARDQNARKRDADKRVAAALADFDSENPGASEAERSAFREKTRQRAYGDLGVEYSAPPRQAPASSKQGIGPPKKPIPEDLKAELRQLRANGASEADILQVLQEEGYY